MRKLLLLILPLLVLSVVAAGCTNAGRQRGVKSMTLDFSGEGSGEHEKTESCDTDGQLSGDGNIDDGTLHVTLEDGDGNVVFDQTYNGDIKFTSTSVTGHDGTWTLRGERSRDDVLGDDFKGHYTFNLVC